MATGTPVLHGREGELGSVVRFVTSSSHARLALVLEGEPGAGKTSLWQAAVDAATEAEIRVCASRPGESEVAYSFSAVADLLADLPDEVLAALPDPQRRALEVALLRRPVAEAPVTAHVVAAAVLSLLRAVSCDRRVLVAIDDVQWLDPSSAAVVGFSARRLSVSDGVRFLLTRRLRTGPASGVVEAIVPRLLERVVLPPLSFGAVQSVIFDRLGWRPARAVARRIAEVSEGNPLLALEIAAALRAQGGRVEMSGMLPVPHTLTGLLSTQLDRCGEQAERGVLVVALLSDPREDVVRRVAGADALESALLTRLVTRDGVRLRLAHPLLGSIARERTPPAELRRLRLLLAAAVSEPEEHVRHLALGTVPPDERVALLLVEAARAAADRGASASAAELAEQAWRFTDPAEEDLRVDRLLTAAEYGTDTGDARHVVEQVTPLVGALAEGPTRARALLVLSRLVDNDPPDDMLRDALRAADPALRADILHERAFTLAVGNVARLAVAREWSEEAVELAGATGDPLLRARCSTTLAWVQALQGEDPAAVLARIDPVAADRLHTVDHPDRLLGVRALWRGRTRDARQLLERLRDRAESRQEEWSGHVVELHRVELACRTGDWHQVADLRDRMAGIDAGMRRAHVTVDRIGALLAAVGGDVDRADQLADQVEHLGEVPVGGWQRLEARRARGVARLFVDDAAGAVEHLLDVHDALRAAGVGEPGAIPVAPDLVEALAATGQVDAAHAVLEELDRAAAAGDHPWAAAGAARARGHVLASTGDHAAAATSLAEARDRYAAAGLLFDEARARLALGVLLRRRRLSREARIELETAAAVFDRLGCPALATRSRSEWQRVAGRRSAPGLTAAERQVATLAASGKTNREIAAALVVTVSTVEAHLSRIYAKLGVRGRTEMARLLLDGEAAVNPVTEPSGPR